MFGWSIHFRNAPINVRATRATGSRYQNQTLTAGIVCRCTMHPLESSNAVTQLMHN